MKKNLRSLKDMIEDGCPVELVVTRENFWRTIDCRKDLDLRWKDILLGMINFYLNKVKRQFAVTSREVSLLAQKFPVLYLNGTKYRLVREVVFGTGYLGLEEVSQNVTVSICY